MKEYRTVPVRPVFLGEPVPEVSCKGPGESSDQEAELVLDGARKEATRLLEEARQEAETLKQQGWEEGYRAGKEEGYRRGLEEAKAEGEALRREGEKIREEARVVLKEAKEAYNETIKRAEEKILELAIEIASEIIGREVELNKEIILDIARRAIERVAEGQAYTIYASPEEAAFLRQHREELLKEAPLNARLQVIADPGVRPGGCRVETENGFVDATVDTQLEEIRRLLKGA
ncbi:MAG: hypothetical protein L5656_07660 [Thermanaeromonas sp.]|uniref:FliH/SctL family protein n=1 Tax=Thermanaeromonas sp. TaxID=2003697 RepID=UPI00243A53AE|nr:FliH/SctL family protein [Thermanaeromonas sp.]MCG0278394.1 hypothetical protein [Thermanaeromonas sp.]